MAKIIYRQFAGERPNYKCVTIILAKPKGMIYATQDYHTLYKVGHIKAVLLSYFPVNVLATYSTGCSGHHGKLNKKEVEQIYMDMVKD